MTSPIPPRWRPLAAALGVFAAAAMLALLSAPLWRVVDLRLLQALQAWRPLAARDDLTLLELPDPGTTPAFRRALGQALVQLASRRPARVVLDVNLSAGEGDASVLQGLRALTDAQVRVYAGVMVDRADGDTQLKAAYESGTLAGVGHTELIPRDGLFFYEPVKPVAPGSLAPGYRFLPLLLAGPQTGVEDAAPGVLALPPAGTRLPTAHAGSDGSLGSDMPAAMAGRTVLVASTARECRGSQSASPLQARLCAGGGAWSGPQLLYWAVTDLSSPPGQRGIQPLGDGGTQLGLGLATAALALALQLLTLRMASAHWSPLGLARRLHWLSLGAWLATLLLLAALVALLAHAGLALPVGYAMLLGSAALAISHRHARHHLADTLWRLRRRADGQQVPADIDVFISYSHDPANQAWVERTLLPPLQALRTAQGQPLRIFFDRDDIQVGEDWFRRINLSLLGTRSLVCVWSDDYHLRNYCQWELEYGFRRAAEPGFLFLPLLHLSHGQPLTGPLAAFYRPYTHVRQYIDAQADPHAVARLVGQVAAHLGLPPTPD